MKYPQHELKLTAWTASRGAPLALATLLALLSACGGSAADGTATTSAGTTTTTTTTTTGGSSGSGTILGSTTTTTFTPNLTYTETLSGTDSYTTPAITTDSVLQVRITAGAATTNIGSNFTANYDCIRYTVAGAGQSLQTDVLSVNGTGGSLCGSTEESQIIDLSSSLSAGHGAIPITVSGVQTSFRYQDCLSEPWNYGYMCNLYAPVYPQYEAIVNKQRVAQSATVKIEIMVNSASD